MRRRATLRGAERPRSVRRPVDARRSRTCERALSASAHPPPPHTPPAPPAPLADPAEAARTAALLTGVLHAVEAFVYVKDREGRYLLLNDALARFFGVERDAIVGTAYDAIHFAPETAAAIRANDLAVMARGAPVRVEEVVDVAGERRVYASHKSPYRDAAGAIPG